MPFYRRMVKEHSILLTIMEKHINLAKGAIRAGASKESSSILAKGGHLLASWTDKKAPSFPPLLFKKEGAILSFWQGLNKMDFPTGEK
jgi:hypothetical protein